jgi:hypothetical protein
MRIIILLFFNQSNYNIGLKLRLSENTFAKCVIKCKRKVSSISFAFGNHCRNLGGKFFNLFVNKRVRFQVIGFFCSGVKLFDNLHAQSLAKVLNNFKEEFVFLAFPNSDHNNSFSMQLSIEILTIESVHEVLHPCGNITEIYRRAKDDKVRFFNFLIHL